MGEYNSCLHSELRLNLFNISCSSTVEMNNSPTWAIGGVPRPCDLGLYTHPYPLVKSKGTFMPQAPDQDQLCDLPD
jgi:hypothetical protein